MSSATTRPAPPGKRPSAARSSPPCKSTCRAATSRWSATAAFASSSRWSATITSLSMRRRWPKRPGSTASTCCAPTASCRPSKWPCATGNYGKSSNLRTTKAVLETRPIYHSSDAAIRGHFFCSFLALTLRKELDDRPQAAGLQLEWQDVTGDLDRLVQTTVDSEGRRFVLRNQGRCNLTSGNSAGEGALRHTGCSDCREGRPDVADPGYDRGRSHKTAHR